MLHIFGTGTGDIPRLLSASGACPILSHRRRARHMTRERAYNGGHGRRIARKWRNWQTRQLEGLVVATSWGFESPLPHQQLTDILAIQKLSCCQVCCQESARCFVLPGRECLGSVPSGVIRFTVVRSRSVADRPRSTRCGSGRHRPAVQRARARSLHADTALTSPMTRNAR